MTPALAAVFAVEAMLFAAVGLTALDMRAHARVENLGGVNLWGYRGRVLETKRASEVRIAIAGGDLAFGWGVAPTETLAPFLRRLVALEVERSGAGGRVVTAVDAGAMGLAPREYADWLSHLSILNADVICLVLDPPGHVPSAAAFLPDRRSLAFRRFGYSPILPLVLREKAALIGSPATAAAGDLLARVDALFASPAESPAAAPGDAEYLGAVAAAVGAGVRVAPAGVVVVVPGPVDAAADHSAFAAALAARVAHEPRVRVVYLGDDARLRDRGLRLVDGFSFSAAGHSRVAELVSPRVAELIRTGLATP
ncbi:MAG TPA: hypothetical protein VKD69_15035 [Vicinamibacterales bacterium]|nr:hypothetical protein [Vicinamibacterales bacterium]